MVNSWIMALKHWNSMKGGKYQIPKKGSKEYDEIKEVQNSMINGDGLKQLGSGMKYDKKQTALLKAVEGEKKSAKPNKARDKRIMRKYKKNLKSMTGSGVENIVLENPEESFEVGKIIFGTQTAPTVKDGKVVLPPTPLENLWNSIFG